MNRMNPIYTQKTECQDCYKCVRCCHFKAIKIEDGHAIIIPEACVLCGRCVNVCPAQAKRVRNDLVRSSFLLTSQRRVIASLAPSYISEFGSEAANIPYYLKMLGFSGVSETALGAEIVSAALPGVIVKNRVNISSACPVVVEMIRKYYPRHIGRITPLLSPALAHAKELKKRFGADTEVVFIGPCIAKKKEADDHPDLISFSLSFRDLRELIKNLPVPKRDGETPFVTERSTAGNLYPVEGGLLYTLRSSCTMLEEDYINVSGISAVRRTLASLEELEDGGSTVVMELMACKGGCVNGPLSAPERSVLARRQRVIHSAGRAPMPELSVDAASVKEDF
ncbi:MAG: [Fe-Fe] hydrogenase large subunit C-terminal domain-containing protein, partial [Spirochaetota bacterium]